MQQLKNFNVYESAKLTEELCLSVFNKYMKYAEGIYLGPTKEFTFLITIKDVNNDDWFWVPVLNVSKATKVTCMQKNRNKIIINLSEETDITQLNYAVYSLLKRLVYYDPARDLLVCY